MLTGDRPTGPLHLGHLVGTLLNRVRLQGAHDAFIVVADQHLLTTRLDRHVGVLAIALGYPLGLAPLVGLGAALTAISLGLSAGLHGTPAGMGMRRRRA